MTLQCMHMYMCNFVPIAASLYVHVYVHVANIYQNVCIITKVFIGKLPAAGWVYAIIG